MGKNYEFEQPNHGYKQKRVLAVHDLSCYGTTSLGIVIPVLTAFNHEVVVLPSVILSSTTDIDQDPITLETTDWMGKVIARWDKRGMFFDAIYTGWLGNPKQIDLLTNLCEVSQHNQTTIFIDPVLGDGGELYPYQEELAKEMSRLVTKAQVITPNPTEAALLLKRRPQECGVKEDGTINAELAEDMVTSLSTTYPSTLAVVKSVVWKDNIGVCVRFTSDNTFDIREPVTETILAMRAGQASIGGTGELFATLLVGRWLKQELGRQSNQSEKLAIIRSSVETISSIMDTVQYDNRNTLPFRSLLYVIKKYYSNYLGHQGVRGLTD